MSAGPERAGSPVARRSLSDGVYDAVLEMLMDQQLEPGAVLSIDGLARRLGVSPTPVREALARLEGPGLVRRTALKGYRVAPLLGHQELADLMDARLVLEPVLAFRACERASDDLVRELRDILDAQRTADRGPEFSSFQAFLRTDEEFHGAIKRQAGNVFLAAAADAIGGQVQRFRLFAGQGVIDADQATAEHEAVLEAFVARDPQGAAEAMREHIARAARRAAEELEEIIHHG